MVIGLVIEVPAVEDELPLPDEPLPPDAADVPEEPLADCPPEASLLEFALALVPPDVLPPL